MRVYHGSPETAERFSNLLPVAPESGLPASQLRGLSSLAEVPAIYVSQRASRAANHAYAGVIYELELTVAPAVADWEDCGGCGGSHARLDDSAACIAAKGKPAISIPYMDEMAVFDPSFLRIIGAWKECGCDVSANCDCNRDKARVEWEWRMYIEGGARSPCPVAGCKNSGALSGCQRGEDGTVPIAACALHANLPDSEYRPSIHRNLYRSEMAEQAVAWVRER